MLQQTIRLFVSSTFSDFQAERAALQTSVFPKLRALCESHGITFQAIDLRWGVSAEHVRRHLTMDVCLEEVRRCLQESPKPNFLGMLGDRWGWQPAPSCIRVALFEALQQSLQNEEDRTFLEGCYPTSSLDLNALPHTRSLQLGGTTDSAHNEVRLRELMEAHLDRLPFTSEEKAFLALSATAMEFQVALLDPADSASLYDSALVVNRTIAGLPMDATVDPYLDVQEGRINPLHKERVSKLKQHLGTLLEPSRLLVYSEHWLGRPDVGAAVGLNPEISHNSLPSFIQQVLATLTQQIQLKIDSLVDRSAAQLEQQLHAAFGAEACRIFAGRLVDRAALLGVLQTPSLQQTPTLVLGAAGGGVTTLIARAVADYSNVSAVRTVVRYINSTPSASTAKALIMDLFAQINPGQSVPNLPSRIQAALEKLLSENPCTWILDGLDHLPGQDARWLLSCIPKHLPQGSAVLFSCAQSSPLANAPDTAHMRKHFISTLTLEDGIAMLDAWLADGSRPRSLTGDQREEVLRAFSLSGSSPLYLRMAAQQARRWKHSDAVPRLAEDINSMVVSYFHWLTHDSLHGQVFLRTTLALIGASRSGIAEVELLDILSQDPAVLREYANSNPFAPDIGRLPDIIWSRLYAELKPFLALTDAQTRPVVRFRHREFQQVVVKQTLTGEFGLSIRMRLVNYFENQRNQITVGDYAPLRMRPFHEIPWQLMQSGQYEELRNFLVQPGVIRSMMDSYNIHPGKDVIIGNLVQDLAIYWTALQQRGYEPRTELLQSIKAHRSTVEESVKTHVAGPTLDQINIPQLAQNMMTVQVDRLLNYLGEGGLGSEINRPALLGEEASVISEIFQPLEVLTEFFELKRQQLVLRHRIKSDVQVTGHTAKEKADRLIDLTEKLKGSVSVAQRFIAEFELGASNSDETFGVGYLGAINWWPLAQAYYLIDQPDRAIATFQDVIERLANAPAQEFLAQLIEAKMQFAGALRSVQRYSEACEGFIEVVELMDGAGLAWQGRIPALLGDTFNIALEAEIDARQLAVLQRLAGFRAKYFQIDNALQETINLMLTITHHPCQAGASYSPEMQELLLKVCRTGLGLLMESKRFEETRRWAASCLPAYEKVFGIDGERSIALRGIAEPSRMT
ncbi:DUF4062 domain-containing protein [Curvibacter sp. AEP1-3]|uniref:DUF4062 domain-containing protein n=1 Tax=Curvibacter sp. AEP1-3 TaxID=1844971 RepID=UPI000B3CBE86|nr:DUF4062 domain-containing protein [Curvibacter sp. AEP1-3]